MKTKISLWIPIVVLAIVLIGCESINKASTNLGDVTVEGTLDLVANPCPPSSDPCLPGIEVALRSDRIYFLNNILIIDRSEDEFNMIFLLEDNVLSEKDSIRINGTLFRYIDMHKNYYYRINVKDYQILTHASSLALQ